MAEAAIDVVELITTRGLYAKVTIPEESMRDALAHIYSCDKTFDIYCPECGQMATYRATVDNEFQQWRKSFNAMVIPGGNRITAYWELRTHFSKMAVCTRNTTHMLICHFYKDSESIQKTGQYPSLADFAISEIREFKAVLGNENYKELNRAIGLNAHGVGVGAFVYLRRIFETLVEEAHQAAKPTPGWDEDAFQKMRTSERVKALAGHLPDFMVENHTLYGILSAHIHDLSEEVCLANFEVVKQGILSIAESKIAALRLKARHEASRKAIAALASPAAKAKDS